MRSLLVLMWWIAAAAGAKSSEIDRWGCEGFLQPNMLGALLPNEKGSQYIWLSTRKVSSGKLFDRLNHFGLERVDLSTGTRKTLATVRLASQHPLLFWRDKQTFDLIQFVAEARRCKAGQALIETWQLRKAGKPQVTKHPLAQWALVGSDRGLVQLDLTTMTFQSQYPFVEMGKLVLPPEGTPVFIWFETKEVALLSSLDSEYQVHVHRWGGKKRRVAATVPRTGKFALADGQFVPLQLDFQKNRVEVNWEGKKHQVKVPPFFRVHELQLELMRGQPALSVSGAHAVTRRRVSKAVLMRIMDSTWLRHVQFRYDVYPGLVAVDRGSDRWIVEEKSKKNGVTSRLLILDGKTGGWINPVLETASLQIGR